MAAAAAAAAAGNRSPRRAVGAWESDAVPQLLGNRANGTAGLSRTIALNSIAFLLAFSVVFSSWFEVVGEELKELFNIEVSLLHYMIYAVMALFAVNVLTSTAKLLLTPQPRPASTTREVHRLLGMPGDASKSPSAQSSQTRPEPSAMPAVQARSPRSPASVPSTPSAVLLSASGSPFSPKLGASIGPSGRSVYGVMPPSPSPTTADRGRTADLSPLAQSALPLQMDFPFAFHQDYKKVAYQVASPDPLRRTASDTPSKRTQTIGMSTSDEAHDKLMAENIALYMEGWTENVRWWISVHVLKPLVERLDRFDQLALASNQPGLRFYSTAVPTGFGASMQQYMHNEFAKEHYRLSLHLAGPRGQREYTLNRLRSLSESAMLGGFRHNSGDRYANRDWTDELPTDAELVMHFVCRYFDENLGVQEDPKSQFPVGAQQMAALPPMGEAFTNLYLVTSASPASWADSNLHIRMVSKKPPNYRVVVNKEAWPVTPHHNNVFHALILFFHVVRTQYGGYIRSLDIGSPAMDIIGKVFKS